MFAAVETLESVPSTNDYLKRFVARRRPRVVRAREQTAGKGQYGRGWHSAKDEGLYVSLLLYPSFPARESAQFNSIAIAAVLDALRECGAEHLDFRVKQPNDIYVGERKAAGILTEMGSQDNRILWAIVGIGINLRQRSFPPDLEERATSLALEGVEIDPDHLFKVLLESFKRHWKQAHSIESRVE